MKIHFEANDPGVVSVLHPTDLSEASLVAFHHALALGVRYGAAFTLLHAIGRRRTDSWPDFPSAGDTLAKWRAAGSMQGLEDRIGGSTMSKVEVPIPDPIAAAKEHTSRHATDLLVLATDSKKGLSRLIQAPRAERLARELRLPTLFVPEGGKPFVSGETGEVTLKKILVPVSPNTDPQPAMLFAVRTAATVEDPSVEIALLYVGDGEESEELDVPNLPFCVWHVLKKSGAPSPVVLGVAEEIDADAIVMSTSWEKSSVIRGAGVTQSVLEGARCPIATIPV